MEYMSFKTEDAQRYGLHEAILLNHIRYWVEKNRANEKHFHDDRYWTYNSNKAYQSMFPFMTSWQIRSALNKLVDNGLIVTGYYNDKGYDRTKWYTTEVCEVICEPNQNHLITTSNGIATSIEPIPRQYQDNKQDTPINANDGKKQINTQKKSDIQQLLSETEYDDGVMQSISDYIEMRKVIKKPMSYGAVKLLLSAIKNLPDQRSVYIKKALEISILSNWLSVYPIRNERDLPPEEKIAYVEERDPNENISWFDPRFDPNACCRKTSVGTGT